jgi:probable F420-dependent oxidoreductase
MRIGLFAALANPVATPEYVKALGEAAEQREFSSIWVAEHVVLFDDYASRYPYAEDGKIPVAGATGILDPLNALSFLAACTSTVRLGTGICLVPQRNPVYTAKEVATVDWLSNGRVDFGVGVGWLREEFDAVNVSFAERGARCREYLDVMRRLWEDDVSEHHGRFYDLAPCRQFPKPVQRPHPPIIFGGESDAALQRVADVGDGWYPFDVDPSELADGITDLVGRLDANGRARDDVHVVVCPYRRPADLDLVRGYFDAGADEVVLVARGRDIDALRSNVDELATTILEPARRG